VYAIGESIQIVRREQVETVRGHRAGRTVCVPACNEDPVLVSRVHFRSSALLRPEHALRAAVVLSALGLDLRGAPARWRKQQLTPGVSVPLGRAARA
jgi:hypothetical protein